MCESVQTGQSPGVRLSSLKVKSAYLDGELCALNGDGVPIFSRLQAAKEGRTDQLVFFVLVRPPPLPQFFLLSGTARIMASIPSIAAFN